MLLVREIREIITKVPHSGPCSISRLRAPIRAPFDSWAPKQVHRHNFRTAYRSERTMATEIQAPTMRTESDAFGPIEVDSSRLWGAQVRVPRFALINETFLSRNIIREKFSINMLACLAATWHGSFCCDALLS